MRVLLCCSACGRVEGDTPCTTGTGQLGLRLSAQTPWAHALQTRNKVDFGLVAVRLGASGENGPSYASRMRPY